MTVLYHSHQNNAIGKSKKYSNFYDLVLTDKNWYKILDITGKFVQKQLTYPTLLKIPPKTKSIGSLLTLLPVSC